VGGGEGGEYEGRESRQPHLVAYCSVLFCCAQHWVTFLQQLTQFKLAQRHGSGDPVPLHLTTAAFLFP
jgi:hypothetical protein